LVGLDGEEGIVKQGRRRKKGVGAYKSMLEAKEL